MRRKLTVSLMSVMLVALIAFASGCAGVSGRVVGATTDVVMAGPNLVVGQVQVVGDLVKGATQDNWLDTLGNVVLYPVTAAKAGLESLANSLGNLRSHLGGK